MEGVGLALSLETPIHKMLGSNSDRDTGYLDLGSFWVPSVNPDKYLNSTGRTSKDNMRLETRTQASPLCER
jgi:hypothetical protein